MKPRLITTWFAASALAVCAGCKDKPTGASSTPPGGPTSQPAVDDGSATVAAANRNRLGSPAALSRQVIRLSSPRSAGDKIVAVDFEIAAGQSAPARAILVFIYADGFDSRELDMQGLSPGTKRTATIELQKNVAVNFAQIDFWAGAPGGSALVGSDDRISNIVSFTMN